MNVSIGEALGLNRTFIDLRSPREFEEDTIPGAVNVPLFDNSEHKIIGTIYHQAGQDAAIEEGMKFVMPKLDVMIGKISEYPEPILFCWRGGLRSQSVYKCLLSKNIKSYILNGGYREYRRYVHAELKNVQVPKLIVLHGLAGAGKTRLIRRLQNSIDLEGFAQHRASLFGGLGLHPRTQKMFESLLLDSLRKPLKYLVVEGESRRIGDLHIPERFFDEMKKGVKIWVDCDKQKRIKNLMEDYGKAPKEDLRQVLLQLKKFVSASTYTRLIHYMNEDDLEKLAEILLDEYYDKRYLHILTRDRYDYVIDSTDEDKAVKELERFIQELTLK